MAKNDSTNDANTVLSGVVSGDTSNPAQQQLAALMLKRLQEQEHKEQEERSVFDAARKSNIDATRQRMALEKLSQEQCAHVKPYGESNLVGQRMHSGTLLMMCQACRKTWDGSEKQQVPGHLRINGERIGGPQY